MAEPELRVIVESPQPTGSSPILRVFGEVDILTSPILDEHLTRVLDEGSTSVVVDLEGVTFLDSTGLSVLIATLKRCQSVGGSVRLVAARPNVHRVLEITGLAEVFHLGPPGEAGTSD